MKAQMPPFFCASATVWSASVVLPEDSGPKISTTRPRGRPPTPSAMSSPSEPDEMVSMSIERSFLPSRMIDPLPKLRSICESAASRAFVLSMDDPSTRRRAACDMFAILMTGFPSASNEWNEPSPSTFDRQRVHGLFSVRNTFFLGADVLASFNPHSPLLNFAVAHFLNQSPNCAQCLVVIEGPRGETPHGE